MLSSARGEYERRGSPVSWTGWELDTVHEYMKVVLTLESGEPAKPTSKQEIMDALKATPAPAEEDEDSNNGQSQESDDDGDGTDSEEHEKVSEKLRYVLLPSKKSKKAILCDRQTGTRSKLSKTKEKCQLYYTSSGMALWLGKPHEPKFCRDFFEDSDKGKPVAPFDDEGKRAGKGHDDSKRMGARKRIVRDPAKLPGMAQAAPPAPAAAAAGDGEPGADTGKKAADDDNDDEDSLFNKGDADSLFGDDDDETEQKKEQPPFLRQAEDGADWAAPWQDV